MRADKQVKKTYAWHSGERGLPGNPRLRRRIVLFLTGDGYGESCEIPPPTSDGGAGLTGEHVKSSSLSVSARPLLDIGESVSGVVFRLRRLAGSLRKIANHSRLRKCILNYECIKTDRILSFMNSAPFPSPEKQAKQTDGTKKIGQW